MCQLPPVGPGHQAAGKKLGLGRLVSIQIRGPGGESFNSWELLSIQNMITRREHWGKAVGSVPITGIGDLGQAHREGYHES